MKPSKDRLEGHRKQEAARRTALSHAPGHDELSSGHSCKFHVRGAVAVDSSKETADELGQLCSFQYMQDPGVIDNWDMQRQNLAKEYLTLVGHTQQGQSSLDLANVISHLSGRDASLRTMYASHGVPVKASTNCRGKNLAIAIARRQRT